MSEQDLIQELCFNSKWLSQEYKDSNYYREYLDVFNKDLKQSIKQ